MRQVIPIYGFGILLYILFILFKFMSKGMQTKSDSGFFALKSEDLKKKISPSDDHALVQLQEKVKEMEEMMESIVSTVSHDANRIRIVTTEYEEKLLCQLRGITRVKRPGRTTKEISPEVEAEEEWEEYPEALLSQYEDPTCGMRFDPILLKEPIHTHPPTAEELAERMEEEEKDLEMEQGPRLQSDPTEDLETEMDKKRPGRGLQVSFSDQKDLLCYLEDDVENDNNEEEDEDEGDPTVKAESLMLDCKVCTDLGEVVQNQVEDQEDSEDLEEPENIEGQDYLEYLEEQENVEYLEEQENVEYLEEQEDSEEQNDMEDLEKWEGLRRQDELEEEDDLEEQEEDEDSDEQENFKEQKDWEEWENSEGEDIEELFHTSHQMEDDHLISLVITNQMLRKRNKNEEI
ncbi:glutamic acid-rich protein-like [Megalops cyprinoides]|uniref:glutamic acid-rich protein-like n=1 Tax=Megalops cyprinoides TaxID=118141 RepID=UPI00186552AB|nr:glutamic acid-rich protein-like [Megalops cyprinoides]